MEENNQKKEGSTMDKIIMGAIIGTAIGSAVGITLAPKKGEETRKIIKESIKENSGEAKEVFKLATETLVGIFKIGKRIFFGKQSGKAQDYKKIPDESTVEIIDSGPSHEKKKTN